MTCTANIRQACRSVAVSDELLQIASDLGRSRSLVTFQTDEMRGTAVLQCAVAVFEGLRAARLDGAALFSKWLIHTTCG